MSTAAHEPGRTAYEARFAGHTLGPRGVAEAWEDLLPVHQAIWARVEEAVLASAHPSPGDPVRAALAYTSVVGDAGASYLKSVSLDGEYHLSGTFRWHELFDAMMAAALSVSTPTGEGEAIARALSEAEWPDVSIGNKALIQAAIQALRHPAALAHPQQGGERDGALRVALKEITEAADELLITLPGHWHDDATIRLTDAAGDARKALKSAEQDDLYEPNAPTSPSKSSGEEAKPKPSNYDRYGNGHD